MSILPITIYGDKILRKKVDQVTQIDDKTIELIRFMFDTMRNANGIGLAANQVGINKSIFVVDISPVENYEKYKPITIINPRIVNKSDETSSFEEGCLSIPDIRAEVIRPKEITIKYQDIDLSEQQIDADDLYARVIQHEFDHLKGILFTDLISDELKKQFKKSLNKIQKRKIEIDYPISENTDYRLL
ncbi:MAG TPA: peptide deformylase [Ignavibacteriaceae bacterium]|nr:peptide deformylase [Ignavibacteriaceae bacterium]